MRRKAIVFLFISVIISTSYAGSFFVNYTIINGDKEKIDAYLSTVKNRIIGVSDKTKPERYVLYEEKADEQDTEYGLQFGEVLSRELQTPVLFILVHDSDVLLVHLIVNGGIEFSYDSWPGYFDGNEQKPAISGEHSLPDYFDIDIAEFVKEITLLEEPYVFAEDILAVFCKYLNLSDTVFLGYRYAVEDKSMFSQYGFELREWN